MNHFAFHGSSTSCELNRATNRFHISNQPVISYSPGNPSTLRYQTRANNASRKLINSFNGNLKIAHQSQSCHLPTSSSARQLLDLHQPAEYFLFVFLKPFFLLIKINWTDAGSTLYLLGGNFQAQYNAFYFTGIYLCTILKLPRIESSSIHSTCK